MVDEYAMATRGVGVAWAGAGEHEAVNETGAVKGGRLHPKCVRFK